MILVTCQSSAACQTLRNIERYHEETVVDRFGSAALFRPSYLGLFHALRLREKYDSGVQLRVTRPIERHRDVPPVVDRAVKAYERRPKKTTPYEKFAVGTPHPTPTQLRRRRVRFDRKRAPG